jgi:lipopolysaccharide export system protein LptC
MSPAQQSARERLLDGLRQRRTGQSTAGMARRSLMITWLKRLLPAAALLLLVLLAIAPNLRFGPAADRVTYHAGTNAGTGALSTMQNAQYHGVDQRGQPFTLTADEANQRGADDVLLAKPVGDITLNSGAWLMLRSDAGVFNQKSQLLNLNGNVTLYRNDGSMMTTPVAAINLRDGTATGKSPVAAQGPFGTLNAANGFDLTGRGNDIKFLGPVTLTLVEAGPTAAPQAGQAPAGQAIAAQ